MTSTLTPLVSLLVSGASLTEHDDLPPGTARLGCPVWGRAQLLANLELRLGLLQPPPHMPSACSNGRGAWPSSRPPDPVAFYARSYAVDPVGTATAILAWRDELVIAGWNGDADRRRAASDSRRCASSSAAVDSAPGRARLICAAWRASCEAFGPRSFDALLLAEPRALWPGRWQRVLALPRGARGVDRDQ